MGGLQPGSGWSHNPQNTQIPKSSTHVAPKEPHYVARVVKFYEEFARFPATVLRPVTRTRGRPLRRAHIPVTPFSGRHASEWGVPQMLIGNFTSRYAEG